jgi:putative transposase
MLNKKFKTENQENYRDLSTQSSQQTIKLVEKNLKSYFGAIKKWKTDKTGFNGQPKFPKYKHKTKGRFTLIYTNQQIGYKNGYITFPKQEGISPLKTNVSKEQIQQVRFIPKPGYYVVEVVYRVVEVKPKENNGKYISIDIGVNNLATCISTDCGPFIINGKPLKSINQFYNKKLARLKSELKTKHNRNSSKKINKLTLKRNNKVKDYLHKASKKIASKCVEHDIRTVIVGYNNGWKQEVNLGKKTNQNFVHIPFDTFINQLRYKSERQGIGFVEINESHTSKCSSLDLEEVGHHDVYVGKRVKRGLFRTSKGILLNADVNAAFNILRKGSSDAVFQTACIGFGCNPIKLKFNNLINNREYTLLHPGKGYLCG